MWLPLEAYGTWASATDPYPPLTQIIREYVPRWAAFLLILGFAALAAGTWFHLHKRWWLALLGALVGWLIAHFDAAYDAPAVAWDNAIYQWYAKKLHLRRWQTRLVENQVARDKTTTKTQEL